MDLFKTKSAPTSDYRQMPDHARIWIYQADREFTDDETSMIRDRGNAFVKEWAAHGQALFGAFEVFHNRFLVLFLDEAQAGASGCSIDSSVGLIRSVMADFKVDLLDKMNLAYRNAEGGISALRMPEFQKALDAGELNAGTVVFNNLVATKGEFDAKWEVPVQESWHRQML